VSEASGNDSVWMEEYQRRVGAARAAMEARGVDALVLSDPANFHYFTGWSRPFTGWNGNIKARPFMVIVPRTGAPLTFIQLPYERAGRDCTWVGASKAWATLPFRAEQLAETLGEMGLGDRTLAVESGGGERLDYPFEEFSRLGAVLPKARFADSGPITQSIRSLKSALEVEAIRQVRKASLAAFRHALLGMRAGMDAAAAVRKAKESLFAEGCDQSGFCRIFPAGDTSRGLDPAALLASGPVTLWGGGIIDGYRADVTVPGVVDSSGGSAQAPPSNAAETLRRMGGTLRTGRTVAQAAGDCAEILAAAAGAAAGGSVRAPRGTMLGHGVGLDTRETPLVTADNPAKIAEGMVISLGLEYRTPGGWVPLRETFAVTALGVSVLPE
jgi:Xaa-Pro aminopeptidase